MRPPLQRLVNSCKDAEEVFVENDRSVSECKALKLKLDLPMHQLSLSSLADGNVKKEAKNERMYVL